jgi:hypothetical protein
MIIAVGRSYVGALFLSQIFSKTITTFDQFIVAHHSSFSISINFQFFTFFSHLYIFHMSSVDSLFFHLIQFECFNDASYISLADAFQLDQLDHLYIIHISLDKSKFLNS